MTVNHQVFHAKIWRWLLGFAASVGMAERAVGLLKQRSRSSWPGDGHRKGCELSTAGGPAEDRALGISIFILI